MSDIEQRLRDALNARAELVRPEDLSLNPVLERPDDQTGPWWQRPGGYLFIAAVAVIVIALPLLALAATGPDGDPRPLQPATDPTGAETMTDPTRQATEDEADVDGDGTLDQVRLESIAAAEGAFPDHQLEVELSTSGATVSYDLGRLDGAMIGPTANLDGRTGEEVVVALEPESIDIHLAEPVVISLRDGELESILADDLGPDQEGTRTYWWVNEGRLWWWRSQQPVAEGEQSPYAVDVLRFPRDVVLRGVPYGTWCVTSLASTRLTECGEQEPPRSTDPGDGPDEPSGTDTDAPVVGGIDPWWEEAAEGLPATWAAEGGTGGFSVDADGDGTQDAVSVTGGQLRVDVGDEQLTTTVDGPSPTLEGAVVLDGRALPVVVGHTAEGAAGTTHVSWFAYAVIGGELVELDTAPLGPVLGSQYSNLTPAEGGHPTVRTWRPDGGSLFGMDYLGRAQVEGPDGVDVWAYRVRVRSWYVDGTYLRATTLGQGCVAPELGNQFSGCPDGL